MMSNELVNSEYSMNKMCSQQIVYGRKSYDL